MNLIDDEVPFLISALLVSLRFLHTKHLIREIGALRETGVSTITMEHSDRSETLRKMGNRLPPICQSQWKHWQVSIVGFVQHSALEVQESPRIWAGDFSDMACAANY